MERTEIRITLEELVKARNFLDHLKREGFTVSEDMKFIRTDGNGIGYTLEVEVFANINGVGVDIKTEISGVDGW